MSVLFYKSRLSNELVVKIFQWFLCFARRDVLRLRISHEIMIHSHGWINTRYTSWCVLAPKPNLAATALWACVQHVGNNLCLRFRSILLQ